MSKKEKPEYGPLGREPIDLTQDGKCSMCGGCCSSILPVTDEELAQAKAYMDERALTPDFQPDGSCSVMYFHCPFLSNEDENGHRACKVYEVRPAVCRSFLCSRTNEGNARKYVKKTRSESAPEPVNAWKVFNRTGLVTEGQEIPYDNGPRVELSADTGARFRFQVGHPVSLIIESGERVPMSMCVGIFKNGIQVFNAETHELMFIPFKDMREVLSKESILPPKDNSEPDEDHTPVTPHEILKGLEKGIVRLGEDPNLMDSVVCFIGDDGNWFYFHEEPLCDVTPEQYRSQRTDEELAAEIAEAVNAFLDYPEGLTEFAYYRAVLNENGISGEVSV